MFLALDAINLTIPVPNLEIHFLIETQKPLVEAATVPLEVTNNSKARKLVAALTITNKGTKSTSRPSLRAVSAVNAKI